MSADLRILITNDDGIDAPGLEKLVEIARQISEDVWVVAPRGNQSGAGHRFSLGHELHLEQREPRVFSVDGTPADCVVAGCTHVLGARKPDVVLAGVNHGQNLGDVIHCSGTLGAAREGALQGALGIGLSQAVDYANGRDVSWDAAVAHGPSVVRGLIAHAAKADTYYNVNFPHCAADEVSGVQIVTHQRFSHSPFSYYQSRNEGKFFVAVLETPLPIDPGSDFDALHHDNAVTVTPLTLRMTDAEQAAHLAGRLMLAEAEHS